MRVLKGEWLTGLGLAAMLVALIGASAWAQDAEFGISSDRAGSIAMFPKVIADGSRDTIIKITNTSNSFVNAHCVYVDGHSECGGDLQLGLCQTDSDCTDLGVPCMPIWLENDFDIALTRQQPTMWSVRSGRRVGGVPSGPACTPDIQGGLDCPGFFFTSVPAQGPDFQGFLWCVQTDGTGGLLGGDALKGEAVLVTDAEDGEPTAPAVSKYNSINVPAVGQSLDPSAGIRLDGQQYAACPDELQFSHYNDRAEDVTAAALDSAVCDTTLCVGGADDGSPCSSHADCAVTDPNQPGVCRACPVRTQITLMPCTQNLEQQTAPVVTTTLNFRNEFEEHASVGNSVRCWQNDDLGNIHQTLWATDGTYLRTRVNRSSVNVCQECGLSGPCPASCTSHLDCGPGGLCAPNPGLVGIVEEFYDTSDSLATIGLAAAPAAANMHMRGERTNGVCDLADGSTLVSCSTDADCTGSCVMDRLIINPDNL